MVGGLPTIFYFCALKLNQIADKTAIKKARLKINQALRI